MFTILFLSRNFASMQTVSDNYENRTCYSLNSDRIRCLVTHFDGETCHESWLGALRCCDEDLFLSLSGSA